MVTSVNPPVELGNFYYVQLTKPKSREAIVCTAVELEDCRARIQTLVLSLFAWPRLSSDRPDPASFTAWSLVVNISYMIPK